MARSYRKPWVVDGYGSQWKQCAKRTHNRKVRRKLKNPKYEIEDGCSHKRGHGLNPWDISDYRWEIKKPVADRIRFIYWSGEHCIETLEEQMQEYRKVTRK